MNLKKSKIEIFNFCFENLDFRFQNFDCRFENFDFRFANFYFRFEKFDCRFENFDFRFDLLLSFSPCSIFDNFYFRFDNFIVGSKSLPKIVKSNVQIVVLQSEFFSVRKPEDFSLFTLILAKSDTQPEPIHACIYVLFESYTLKNQLYKTKI
jgi:hypothetical protein